MKKFLLPAIGLLLAMGACAEKKEVVEDDVYLFSYFTGQSDGLHLAYSYDGLKWTAINDNK